MAKRIGQKLPPRLTVELMAFCHAIVMNPKRSLADCYAEAYGVPKEEKVYTKAARAIKRPSAVAYLEQLKTSPAYLRMKEAEERFEEVRQELEDTTRLLQNSIVERKHLVAYWETVLLTGAKKVLDDIQTNNGRKYGHLVESFTVTKDSIKITTPSRKDASAILTVLKKLDKEDAGKKSTLFDPIPGSKDWKLNGGLPGYDPATGLTSEDEFTDPARYILTRSTGPTPHP